MFKVIGNKDNWIVLALLLGGGTFIKTLGFQSYYLILLLFVLLILSLKEDYKPAEILRVTFFVALVSLLQLSHTINKLFYEFFSTQYFRVICQLIIAFLVAKRYSTRKDVFISSYNTVFIVVIIHAIVVVFVSSFFDLKNQVILAQSESAVYTGPNILFMIRSHLNNSSEVILNNLFGIGIQRAHGIFWEPSVFANYTALFIFINVFVSFSLPRIVLGIVAIIFAWSSTGFLLLLFISVSVLIWGNRTEEVQNIRVGTLILLIPLSMGVFLWNVSSATTDNLKAGSFAQRFYDTMGAVKAVVENPIIGSGVNLEAYDDSITDAEIIDWTDKAAKTLEIKNKRQIKYSNSFLRLFLHYGIPLSLVYMYGLWNQKLIDTKYRLALTLIIILGASFSPILELTVLSPFIYSGLVLSK